MRFFRRMVVPAIRALISVSEFGGDQSCSARSARMNLLTVTENRNLPIATKTAYNRFSGLFVCLSVDQSKPKLLYELVPRGCAMFSCVFLKTLCFRFAVEPLNEHLEEEEDPRYAVSKSCVLFLKRHLAERTEKTFPVD